MDSSRSCPAAAVEAFSGKVPPRECPADAASMLVRRHADNSLTCRRTPLKFIDIQLTALAAEKKG